jgi:hypothetical protein
MVKVEEQALVEKLVAHAAVEALTEAGLHRLSRRNEMPDDRVVVRPGQHGVRGKFGAVVGDDYAGFAAALDQDSQLRATRCPEIDVSGMAVRHSRVTSSTMFRMRNRRPQAS